MIKYQNELDRRILRWRGRKGGVGEARVFGLEKKMSGRLHWMSRHHE